MDFPINRVDLLAIFFIFQQYWADMHPTLLKMAGSGSLGHYIAAHPVQCPLNGQILSVITAACSATGFILVSFLTYKRNFNLDEMLHRGKYSLNHEDRAVGLSAAKRFWLTRFLDINEHFTRGDKVITYGTFAWSVVWQLIAVGILLWTVIVGRLSPNAWFNYQLYLVIGISLVLAVPTTVWFTIGVSRDLVQLLRALRTTRRSDADDGTVRDHHNLEEIKPQLVAQGSNASRD